MKARITQETIDSLILNEGEGITLGKEYEVYIQEENMLCIINDNNDEDWFYINEVEIVK